VIVAAEQQERSTQALVEDRPDEQAVEVDASDEPPVFVHHRGGAAIRVVTSGQGLVAPQVMRRLIAEFARQPGRRIQPDRLRRLTERERQHSRSSRAACRTPRSPRRWWSARRRSRPTSAALAKLECRDRVQAVVFAYEAGIVEAGV
jgi:hypothetical protein